MTVAEWTAWPGYPPADTVEETTIDDRGEDFALFDHQGRRQTSRARE
jgi:hypothetical protein